MSRVAVVQQAQCVQTSADRIEVRVRLSRALTGHERAMLVGIVQDAMGYPFEVDVAPVDLADPAEAAGGTSSAAA